MNHLQRPPPLGSGQKTLKGPHSAARGQSENATLTLTSGVFRESETETAAWSINRHTPPWRSLYCCCSSRPSPQVGTLSRHISRYRSIRWKCTFDLKNSLSRIERPESSLIWLLEFARNKVDRQQVSSNFRQFEIQISNSGSLLMIRIVGITPSFCPENTSTRIDSFSNFSSLFDAFVLALSFPRRKRRLRRPVHSNVEEETRGHWSRTRLQDHSFVILTRFFAVRYSCYVRPTILFVLDGRYRASRL